MKYYRINAAHIMTLLLFSFSTAFSQPQTRTYTTGKAMKEIPRFDYMGTFSAIYYVEDKKPIQIDPELSFQSALINDSVIKKRVVKINHAGHLINDSVIAKRLRNELINVINYAKSNKTIKGFKPDSIFSIAGEKSTLEYSMYFVSTGFVKDSILGRKIKNQRILSGVAGTLSLATIGIGYFPVFTQNPNQQKLSENALTWQDAYNGIAQLSGYIIVYNKTTNEIALFREQFFTKDKNPMDIDNIVKQIKYAFKENFN